jgi:tight adherence protein B
MDSNLLLLLVVFGGMMGMLVLIYFATQSASASGGKAFTKRLDKLQDRFGYTESALQKAQMRRVLAYQETKLDSVFKNIIPNRDELVRRLRRTGKDITLGHYGVATGVIFLVGTVLLALGLNLPWILAALIGALLGLMVPHLVINQLISKRAQNFVKLFPDAIDLMVRGLRSGLPISESIGVVGPEFAMVADKIKIGKTMDLALNEMGDRLAVPEIQFFIITLAIQRETGGNLAETLSNLGDILRKRMQMKLKIRAMSSEARASAYILGCLPFVIFGIIYMIAPDYMATFWTDIRLSIIAGGAMVWMGIGIAIMAKMISFEI